MGVRGTQFRFYSYRDPRLMETFDDFDKSLEWLASEGVSDDSMEEAVLGVLGSIDAPGSPAGEIKQAYHQNLFGNFIQRMNIGKEILLWALCLQKKLLRKLLIL